MNTASDIVGVGNESAEVNGYINVSLQSQALELLIRY